MWIYVGIYVCEFVSVPDEELQVLEIPRDNDDDDPVDYNSGG